MAYQCPLCGLRFGHRTMLELHIREDHRQRPAPALAPRLFSETGPAGCAGTTP